MPRTTIFLPVSRHAHLDAIFARLELMECEAENISILTYVDGDAELYVKARNLTEQSRFKQRLCVQRPGGTSPPPTDINGRRKRIAAIHNEAKQYLQQADYVFGLEDDTIPPTNALHRLLDAYTAKPHAGYIQGVELGRWGVPYVGAWRADDVYEPTRIESLLPSGDTPLQPIDAGGFYCYLTQFKLYMQHEYAPFEKTALGPDVNYGIWLRRQGFQNYILWSVNCEHRTNHGKSVKLGQTEPRQVAFEKRSGKWLQIK